MAWFTRSGGDRAASAPQLPAVTAESFEDDVVAASRRRPVAVDFWAPWCRPCVAMTPVYVELARTYATRLDIVAVDTQDQPELAARLQVMSLPFVVVYSDGQQVASLAGAQPKKKLMEFFDSTLA